MNGVKFDSGKRDWTLLPFDALEEVVEVLEGGEKKYARDNWKKVPDGQVRYIKGAFRHLIAYQSGEKIDSDFGKSHLAHAICCLLFALWFDKTNHKVPVYLDDAHDDDYLNPSKNDQLGLEMLRTINSCNTDLELCGIIHAAEQRSHVVCVGPYILNEQGKKRLAAIARNIRAPRNNNETKIRPTVLKRGGEWPD